MDRSSSRKNYGDVTGLKILRSIQTVVLQTPLGRVFLMPLRLGKALNYYIPKLQYVVSWTLFSREVTNFTYDITRTNKEYLAHTVSVVTGACYADCMKYIQEIIEDQDIKRYVFERVRQTSKRYVSDASCRFGRRLGWYAFVRILKPQTVVETGVDKGLGSVLLCAALLRNQTEGFYGHYFGTDINPQAGSLLTKPYDTVGKILYGDSIESLKSIPSIDLFINDSDHSAQYERREYDTIAPKLNPGAVILGDNSHTNSVLASFSAERGRRFIFFREEPSDHWYPGGGIGISFANAVSGTRQASV